MLDKTTTFNVLYDFYRPLLSDRQRLFMELYYIEDWSLSEIAEHLSISRQAVHDHIKRVERTLTSYEDALHLAAKHVKRQQLVNEVAGELHPLPEYAKVKPLLDRLLTID